MRKLILTILMVGLFTTNLYAGWDEETYIDKVSDERSHAIYQYSGSGIIGIFDSLRMIIKLDKILSAYSHPTKILIRIDKNEPIEISGYFREYDHFSLYLDQNLINKMKKGKKIIFKCYYKECRTCYENQINSTEFSLIGFTKSINWLLMKR